MLKLAMQNINELEPSPSSDMPDWSREALSSIFAWEPSKQLIRSIRDYQRFHKQAGLINKLRTKIAVLRHRLWSIVTAADVPINCNLGGGIRFTHTTGIVIHHNCKIGPNCCFFQQVTIVAGVEVGGAVDIGAGAKIIKPVKIGSNARIGANAVVTQDVPENATAVGIPARIIK